MPNMDVVVVGDIVCDEWRYVSTNSHNPERAVLCLRSPKEAAVITPGGAGLTALFLQQLGASVTLFSRVDNSTHAQKVLNTLRERGVDISNVVRASEWQMPIKTRYMSGETILVRHDIEDTFLDGCKTGRFETKFFEAAVAGAACVVVSDYDKGYLHTQRMDLVRAARRQNVPVFVDCKGQHIADYGEATGYKINETAARVFSRGFNAELLAECDKDPCAFVYNENRSHFVIMTQGIDGAAYHINGRTYDVPTPVRQYGCHAVGAGDAFMAGFVLWMIMSESLQDITPSALHAAVVAGQLTASEAIKPEGAQLSCAKLLTDYCSMQFKTMPNGKILPQSLFETFARAARNSGKKVVFTNGCFDVLHAGHLHLLQEAKKHGDILVVAVDSDENVTRLKGPERPVQLAHTRASVLAALQIVDAVTVFTDTEDNGTLRGLIKKCKPHYLVKGGDYSPEECVGWEEMTQRKKPGRVVCCSLLPGVSTTKIINKMRGNRV